MPKINDDTVTIVIRGDNNKEASSSGRSSLVEMADDTISRNNENGSENGLNIIPHILPPPPAQQQQQQDQQTMVNHNEQPVTKRQRIDGVNLYNNNNGLVHCEGQTCPDTVIAHPVNSSLVETSRLSVNSGSFPIGTTTILGNGALVGDLTSCESMGDTTTIATSTTTLDETDRTTGHSMSTEDFVERQFVSSIGDYCANHVARDANNESLDTSRRGALLHLSAYASSSSTSSSLASSFPDLLRTSSSENLLIDPEIVQFQASLSKQCLCGVSERVLRRPFESHYIYTTTTTTTRQEANQVRRIAPLSEWPTQKLVHLLSNLQLVFDVYLKQNAKGNICCRIMDVCEALIRNEQNLIDEIIDLCDYDNKFVQFLAGRVLSSFLIIAKDTMTHDNWMKKLMDNLFSFDHITYASVRKISFSLEIIKRIVEWKDFEVHPLDDDGEGGGGGEAGGSPQRLPLPPLENNYFYNAEMVANTTTMPAANSSRRGGGAPARGHQSAARATGEEAEEGHVDGEEEDETRSQCDIINLTDSESFDTSNLKCIAIKNLENKWPALVKNMSTMILSNRTTSHAESCVLTFLNLWESIISVHTNLSIVETLPFYAQLDKFEMLLLNDQLPCTIYKQMLTLFNEALCYGSTLALQDMLPEETCNLAHQIVRHVKDHRILDTLPRVHPQNTVSFIGNRGPTVSYERGSLNEVAGGGSEGGMAADGPDASLGMDKTLLQKMVLLVLKSVAVTVKEIRSDSSDSSIDSSDYEAFQDMVLIERSIRDVLKKLENYMKNTLEFHPESHFSKILIHLFEDQDDYLIEAMVCTLDVTVGISSRNNPFPGLVAMLSPVLTFLEFLRTISNSTDLLLDLLMSNETCFLLYLLRFLKYIRFNWSLFTASCRNSDTGVNCLDDTMGVLKGLRLQISRLVSRSLYPYDISPVLRLLESCESMYRGDELS